ncbi:putative amidophosphoribosyltransferase [Beggiatoa alba B18LD]|uniref:Putative amidophosphoribosyltransferase n=1 Tax=Beggiatoa alba B18LD TaxID=395493 RepID=I3CC42_9GAMM|nr:ComF family protein [Beggiatoa alba]EIJ41185.1 putative amidophosphoribosyltransferase [Beggiatoa alba B18LD]
MSIELKGNWKKGFAYDVHTLSSIYMGCDERGHEQWDTTRTEMGELIYQLKYQNNLAVIDKIIELLNIYKGLNTLDAIIPIPPSKQREIQPVYEIAKALSKKINVPLQPVLNKHPIEQELKNIENPIERETLLYKSLFLHQDVMLSDKNVLLLDDLYRSGSTLRIATDILYKQAKVKNVFVLTMTKTRSKT